MAVREGRTGSCVHLRKKGDEFVTNVEDFYTVDE